MYIKNYEFKMHVNKVNMNLKSMEGELG